VGSDRVPAFQFIKQYNGKDYNMNTVEIKSAGERDPDADDVSGMSASKVRKAITEGDFAIVESALPNSVKNDSNFKQLYIQSVLEGMS
jgi:predicted nucleotidyltransferase